MCAYNTGSLNIYNLSSKKLLNFAASSDGSIKTWKSQRA